MFVHSERLRLTFLNLLILLIHFVHLYRHGVFGLILFVLYSFDQF